MSYSEFLEFRMEGKILAKFLTALIFCFFCIKTKENSKLKYTPFTGLMTISESSV
jgi:hypothetical protein